MLDTLPAAVLELICATLSPRTRTALRCCCRHTSSLPLSPLCRNLIGRCLNRHQFSAPSRALRPALHHRLAADPKTWTVRRHRVDYDYGTGGAAFWNADFTLCAVRRADDQPRTHDSADLTIRSGSGEMLHTLRTQPECLTCHWTPGLLWVQTFMAWEVFRTVDWVHSGTFPTGLISHSVRIYVHPLCGVLIRGGTDIFVVWAGSAGLLLETLPTSSDVYALIGHHRAGILLAKWSTVGTEYFRLHAGVLQHLVTSPRMTLESVRQSADGPWEVFDAYSSPHHPTLPAVSAAFCQESDTLRVHLGDGSTQTLYIGRWETRGQPYPYRHCMWRGDGAAITLITDWHDVQYDSAQVYFDGSSGETPLDGH